MKMIVNSISLQFVQHWAGWSTILGGLFILIKGGVILLTGIQPLYIFEISPLFLGIGLAGLYLCLPPRACGRLAKAGLIVAVVAAVSAPVHLWAELFAPHLIPQEDTATILTPFVVLSGIGAMVSALLLGIVVWPTKGISPAWLPLAIPLTFVMLMIVAIGLESGVGETAAADRLIEIPIAIIGLVWIWLGLIIHQKRLL